MTESTAARRRASYALALAMTAMLPSAAMALGTPQERAACTPDVFRLCSTEIPNVDSIIACLKKEKPKLSEGCRAAFESKR